MTDYYTSSPVYIASCKRGRIPNLVNKLYIDQQIQIGIQAIPVHIRKNIIESLNNLLFGLQCEKL